MGGRRILALILAVVGTITVGIGVAGLLSADEEAAGSSGVATSPTGSVAPSESESDSPSESPSETPTPTQSPSESPSPSPEPTEAPEEFFSRFADAIRGGKPAFLLARLHPFVLGRYAKSDCRTYLGSLDFPRYELEVLSVGRTKVFHWETDGINRDVPHATTVRIRFTEDGDTFIETDTHLVARDDGSLLFLTDCGTPQAGAV